MVTVISNLQQQPMDMEYPSMALVTFYISTVQSAGQGKIGPPPDENGRGSEKFAEISRCNGKKHGNIIKDRKAENEITIY